MTDKEIIKALGMCLDLSTECDGCAYETTRHCYQNLVRDALDLINRQQEIITNISKLIVNNTYPDFNKDGKPVSIWSPKGYKQIEEMVGAGNG